MRILVTGGAGYLGAELCEQAQGSRNGILNGPGGFASDAAEPRLGLAEWAELGVDRLGQRQDHVARHVEHQGDLIQGELRGQQRQQPQLGARQLWQIETPRPHAPPILARPRLVQQASGSSPL